MRHITAAMPQTIIIAAIAILFLFSNRPAYACPTCVATPSVNAIQTNLTIALTASAVAESIAIGQLGSSNADLTSQFSSNIWDTTKSVSDRFAVHSNMITNRKRLADNAINTQSLNCRLHTIQNTEGSINKANEILTKNFEDNLIRMFFNRNYTKNDRILQNLLNLNCKLGQLTPAMMGQKAWNDTNANSPASPCFVDAAFTGASQKMTTLLGDPTLVMMTPTNAQLNILLNPDSGFGSAQTTWSALNTLQKRFVSGFLYCQNLILPNLQASNVYEDGWRQTENMVVGVNNMSVFSKLSTAAHTCYSELIRRTAPNPTTLGITTTATSNQKIGALLIKAGVPAANFQVGGVSYLSPALFQYSKLAFCSVDTHTFYANGSKNGAMIINACNSLKQAYEEQERLHRRKFSAMLAGLKTIPGGYLGDVVSPVRADNAAPTTKVNYTPLPAAQ